MERKTKILLTLFLVLFVGVVVRFMPGVNSSDKFNNLKPTEKKSHQLVLRLGHNINTDSALHAAALRFAEEVMLKSGSRVQVSIHPNQELGNDHQMLEMARKGELDMLLTPTAKLSVTVPEMQYADLPFFFTSREELYAMLDGGPGDALLKKLGRIGLVGFAFWENGFKHFTANRPLRAPADFKGMRFRVMKSRLLMDQFKSLGSTPIPIDFHATRQALADGAVDGQENPLVAIVGMKFHEVQSHLTLSSHGYLAYAFSFSTKVFKTLPAQTRELLVQSAKGITAWERAETQRREEDYLSKIRAAGVDIYKLSEQERKVFREHLAHLPDQYEAVIGPDLLAKTQELRWRAMPAEQREKELVIGLDADLSAGGALAGMAIRRGMELAITDINNQGGLLGRALRLVALDHRAVPSQGLMNIKELATQANLLAVVGGMHGFVVNEELDFIQHSEIPYLIPWAAASDLTQTDHIPNSVFRFSITDAVATPFLLNKATANGRTVGMLLERSLWGRSNEHAARHWRQEYECSSMVGIQYFNRGDEDFDTYLQKLKIQGADTIVMVANPRESIHILEAIAKQAKPMPVYAHWGLTGGDFWKSTKHMLKKVDLSFIQTLTLAPPVNERLKPLIEKYRQTYGLQPDERIMAPVGTVHAWELIHILAQAVESAKSVEHDRVRDALEKIEVYSGVTGDHKKPFTAQRHEALNADDLILTRFNDQGHIVPVGE